MNEATDFVRYLAAKKSVDDRSLNQHVWQALAASLPQRPLNVVELGAGSGTMIERVLERALFDAVDYTAIDVSAENIAALQRRLEQLGFTGTPAQRASFVCRPSAANLFDFIQHNDQAWDVVIAHALLDLFDLPTALPRILSLLPTGGLLYATITFDGITAFEPPFDAAFDRLLEERYHLTMDNRMVDGAPSGNRHSGRQLLRLLPQNGCDIVAAGSSDWVVTPHAGGDYVADEAYFLRFIVETVAGALAEDALISAERLQRWQQVRHQQIDRGELIYIAHQLDVVAQKANR